MARKLQIKTFPHREGDEVKTIDANTATPDQIFTKPYQVVVDGVVIKEWDTLLEVVERYPEDATVTVERFRPIVGG